MSIINYFKETKAEMKNVTWPTRRQSTYATILVIVISVLIAYYLGFFDFLFSKGLAQLLLLK
jgi:preprotein translocase subunit SecE